MPPARLALAGATGNIGRPILRALLDAGHSVTVLSRIGGYSSRLVPHDSLVITEVDFTAVASLTAALKGVEIVVSCLATLAIGSQNPLVEAAVAAGVKRFIPAEFGMDSANPLAARLPVCIPKIEMQRFLQGILDANPSFSYTAIANGMFLDWGLKEGIIVNLSKHTATLYNGGDVPFSATTLKDVTEAVLGVIKHQDQTQNRIVYVQSTVLTQNRLINYAKNIDGTEWCTTIRDTEDIRRESLAEMAKGTGADVEAAMLCFCICAMFHPSYGCDFSAHLDNDLLGLTGISEAELKTMVENLM